MKPALKTNVCLVADTGRTGSNYQLYLLAMPFMILFFLFVIVPVVMAIALALPIII
ncbi:MAG: hypothetical protein ACLR56_13515 [Oscillospiraceae bacterium]